MNIKYVGVLTEIWHTWPYIRFTCQYCFIEPDQVIKITCCQIKLAMCREVNSGTQYETATATYVVWNVESREIFSQGDGVGEPITPIEIQLRIKLMMHDQSQLSGRQWRIHNG